MTKQKTLFDQATPDNSISGFVSREAARMWPNQEHRKRSLAQLRAFLAFDGYDNRPIRQFLPRDVHAFADHLIAQGKSEATVNRYLSTVSKVFSHAVDEQVITLAPKFKFYKTISERPRYFSDLEVRQILHFFSERGDWWMADMTTLALKTGMRKSEIVAVGEGTASITDCGQWIDLPAAVTKTGKARMVSIKHPEANKAAKAIRDGLSKVYSKKRFEYRWGLCKREYARDDDTFVFHVTRHTAATKMANDLQVPTVTIAKVLGHASLSTTAKYVHAKDDTLADISARM